MQKRSYKMTLSILIATLLLLSILPLYMTSAIATLVLYKEDKVTITTSGNVGDHIWVKGTGAGPGVLVSIYWDKVQAANKRNETWAKGNGDFECYVKIPEDLVGLHYVIASDGVTDTKSAEFTVAPKITLTPEAGLKDDTVTVKGTGFESEEVVTLKWDTTPLTTTPAEVKTSTKGSFSCTFKVPTATYATYTVTATGAVSAIPASASFKVGATITLTPAEGPSGTVVSITGRGFTKTSGLIVTITIDATTAPVVEDIKTRSDGTFTGKFIVPTLALDTYTVTASDATYTATLDFEVTGTTEITFTPTSGAPGDSVTIEGMNFTAIANTEVKIDWGTNKPTPLTGYATFKTNSTGGFKSTITVPSVEADVLAPYDVKATDDNGLNSIAQFIVVLVTLERSPSSGPTGTKVLVIGSGFTPDKGFNVTIAGELAINGEGTITPLGNIPGGFYVYVPTVSTGVKKLTVMDTEGVSKSVNFEVTKTTQMILTPSSGPVGYNVTIELHYFTAAEHTIITVTIYNSTYDEGLNGIIKQTPPGTTVTVETNATGSFIGWFEVPDTLALGDYKINATDDNDLTVTLVPFKVVSPTVTMSTGASEYLPGDTVAFFAKCSFKYLGETINVYDPAWNLFSVGIDITTSTAGYYTGTAMMVLPSDAKLGVWNWNATIGTDGTEVEGSFSVVTKPTLVGLSDKVDKLSDSLTKLSDVVDKLSTTVGTSAGDISTLSQAVSDLKTAVDTLKTNLADVATTATTASTAATEAKTAASDAATAAGDAKTAAQAAQSTAAGISTAVYGAMVLSLVAAIAAIVAVITLQRKVAG